MKFDNTIVPGTSGDTTAWRIGVFCQNEEARIADCILAIDKAIPDRVRALITVFINGSTDASYDMALWASGRALYQVEIRCSPVGDKAHAINLFLYDTRTPADYCFCVDGYVIIDAGALDAMALAMDGSPWAMAASGQCVNGRTEAALSRSTLGEGGHVRGGLFCLRPSFVRRMVDRNIRLPAGLYRGDGLLESMCLHDLDAVHTPAVKRRALGVAAATYRIQSLSLLRWRDVSRHLRRKVRQMRGRVENLAIKELIYSRGYEALPDCADDMLAAYLSRHSAPRVSWVDRPFMAVALRQIRRYGKDVRG